MTRNEKAENALHRQEEMLVNWLKKMTTQLFIALFHSAKIHGDVIKKANSEVIVQVAINHRELAFYIKIYLNY